jgi:hypothetical protein
MLPLWSDNSSSLKNLEDGCLTNPAFLSKLQGGLSGHIPTDHLLPYQLSDPSAAIRRSLGGSPIGRGWERVDGVEVQLTEDYQRRPSD